MLQRLVILNKLLSLRLLSNGSDNSNKKFNINEFLNNVNDSTKSKESNNYVRINKIVEEENILNSEVSIKNTDNSINMNTENLGLLDTYLFNNPDSRMFVNDYVTATFDLNEKTLVPNVVGNINLECVPTVNRDLRDTVAKTGVHPLIDPITLQYNFSPSYTDFLQPKDTNFDNIPAFTTASRDTALALLAAKHNCKFMSSSSSTTGVLAQFHMLFSCFRPPDTSHFSTSFQQVDFHFTAATRKPEGVWLRKRKVLPLSKLPLTDRAIFVKSLENTNQETSEPINIEHSQVWGIDAAKLEGSYPNEILVDLGKTMERMITMPKMAFLNSLSLSSKGKLSPSSDSLEAFMFTKLGSFLFRSQIDAQSDELKDCLFQNTLIDVNKSLGGSTTPRTIYDLKTRAVHVIRYNMETNEDFLDYQINEDFLDYQITRFRGLNNSFEREWFDMARSGFLKYSYQLRMGGMAGAYVTYHNTKEVFGFEFISLPQIDKILYGTTAFGEFSFRRTVEMFGTSLDWLFGNQNMKSPFSYLYSSDHVVRITAAASPTEKLLYLYVDRGVTEEDFYFETVLMDKSNIVATDAVKSEVSYKIINDAIKRINGINDPIEPALEKKTIILDKTMNTISSIFESDKRVSLELANHLKRLKHIKEMRPHLFVDFLSDEKLTFICKTLNFEDNSREKLVASLENYLLESKNIMSREDVEFLAFTNRLQVYAVKIENEINDIKVTSPFKYDLGDTMNTRFSIKLISPPPFISMVTDELRKFALSYLNCLQYSALNEITYAPKNRGNQIMDTKAQDKSLKKYCDSLDHKYSNNSATRFFDPPIVAANSFDPRLSSYSPSAQLQNNLESNINFMINDIFDIKDKTNRPCDHLQPVIVGFKDNISRADKILMTSYLIEIEDDPKLDCSVLTFKSKSDAGNANTFQVVCRRSHSLIKLCSMYSFKSWRSNVWFFSSLYLFSSTANPTLKYNRVVVGLLPFIQRITTNALYDSRVDLTKNLNGSYRFKKELYSYFPTSNSDKMI